MKTLTEAALEEHLGTTVVGYIKELIAEQTTEPEPKDDPLARYRSQAPHGWAAQGSTLFAWDNADHTKWHAVYDLIDDRAHASRNLHQEQADAQHIAALLNAANT